MKMRVLVVCLTCVGITVGVALAQGGKTAAESGEHDFGTKIVAVVMGNKDGKPTDGGGYLEKAKVRRLGDRYFLVGQVPDMGETTKNTKGTIVWTPLSEVIQITEFDNIESVRKVFKGLDKD